MPSISTLLLFSAASLLLLVIPGPAVVYIVTRSVDQGRGAGTASMLGVEAGTFLHAIAATVGLSALIASSATAFAAVKYIGAAYLIYLGVRKLVEPDIAPESRPSADRSRLFLRGMLVQLLNPKVAIFFLAFLPQFIETSRGDVALQTLVLGCVFTLLAMLNDGAYAILAATAGRRLFGRGGHRRSLSRLSGGIYIALGVVAALSGGKPARQS